MHVTALGPAEPSTSQRSHRLFMDKTSTRLRARKFLQKAGNL